ncbi:MAG: GYF domain-containing protein [Chthoniobacteraceae bacterium]|jgi:hypothetical protein
MTIWVIKDGQREGPYEEQDVRELVYEGTYNETDPAIRDGQYDWTTLGLLLARERMAAAEAAPANGEEIAPEASAIPAAPAAPAAPTAAPELPGKPPPLQVAVVDFEMPFGSMVMFMVKWVLASIPALLILGVLAAMFWIAFVALIAAVMRH